MIVQPNSFKASETLLGIETAGATWVTSKFGCFKASETLLGIETLSEWDNALEADASKPLKPF